MMKGLFGKNPVIALHGVRPLYGAAFMMGIGLNVWWTTMPFIVRNIGGTESHVGFAWAANMLGYMVCLLVAGAALGHYNPKGTTRAAVAIIFVSTLVMSVIVYATLSRQMVGNLVLIWIAIAAGTIAGAAMSMFWPFLMSWVSEDFEGPALNRRLGTYNSAWSCTAIIGPLISGILVETNTLFPIIFAAGGMVFCCMFLSVASDGSVHT